MPLCYTDGDMMWAEIHQLGRPDFFDKCTYLFQPSSKVCLETSGYHEPTSRNHKPTKADLNAPQANKDIAQGTITSQPRQTSMHHKPTKT